MPNENREPNPGRNQGQTQGGRRAPTTTSPDDDEAQVGDMTRAGEQQSETPTRPDGGSNTDVAGGTLEEDDESEEKEGQR